MTGSDSTALFNSWTNQMKQTTVALSTITNPIIYALFNKKFRQNGARILACRRCVATVAPVRNEMEMANKRVIQVNVVPAQMVEMQSRN